jgi:uncharacterized membrane protein
MVFNFKGSLRLKQEIQTWVDENIITPAQAEQLCVRYGLLGEPPWYRRSGFILKALALLLTGMGLLLLISENWHHFNIPIRMAFGLVPLFAAYFLGFRFLYGDKKEAAELAFFFAGILFGVNIFLQAQIFHISAYYPGSILWWILGTLPVALYFRSNLHHALVQVLFFIWINQQLQYSQFSFWTPVLYAGMIYLLYIRPHKLILFATILNTYLMVYNVNSAIAARGDTGFWLIFVALTVFILTLLPALKSGYDEKFRERLHDAGALTIFFIFYLHTFEEISRSYAGNVFSVAGVVLMAAVILLFLIQREKSAELYSLLAIGGIVLILHLSGIVYNGIQEEFGRIVMILTNFLFFLFGMWFIGHGIRHQGKRVFMSGIFMIVVLAISRYLDLFESYVLTAIVFILSGIFIYFINQYWNKRYE